MSVPRLSRHVAERHIGRRFKTVYPAVGALDQHIVAGITVVGYIRGLDAFGLIALRGREIIYEI